MAIEKQNRLIACQRELEAYLLRTALEATGWCVAAAARELGCGESSVRMALLRRHPTLWAEYRSHDPRPGRPKKAVNA